MAINPAVPQKLMRDFWTHPASVAVDISVANPNDNRTSAEALGVYILGRIAGSDSVTIADGADVAEGATTAAAYTDVTGAAAGTLIGLNKGQYVLTAAMSAKLPASLGSKTGAASLSVVAASDGFNVVATGNVASGAADAGNPIKIGGVASTARPTAVTDGQRINAWFTNHGAMQVAGFNIAGSDAGSNADSIFLSGGSSNYGGLVVRNSVYNGSTVDRQRGDVNGTVVQSGLSSTFWNYAAATGGITNTTTAVTIKAAAGASVRNYLKSMQIAADALGAATEIAVRDGAAGTVLWRGKLGTAGLAAQTITFDPPLKGTANTLMEFVTLTATITGSVFVNAQGFTGT